MLLKMFVGGIKIFAPGAIFRRNGAVCNPYYLDLIRTQKKPQLAYIVLYFKYLVNRQKLVQVIGVPFKKQGQEARPKNHITKICN